METDSTPRLPPLVAAAMVSIIMFCAAGVAALIGVLPAQEPGGQVAATGTAAPLAYTDPGDPPPLTPIREPAPQEPQPQEQVVALRAPSAPPATAARPVDSAGPPALATPAAAATPASPPMASPSACADCATVVAVTPVGTAARPSGVGAVGGAVLGGVVGHQMGKGRGRDAMTAAGAIGGALAGNALEKRHGESKRYDVTVRLPDGSQRRFSVAQAPAFSPGDRVRLDHGKLLPAE